MVMRETEIPGLVGADQDHDHDKEPLILIVEDNADVATYLVSCLQSHYRLEVANDGQDGIDKAVEWVPDLIISDVMMPEKDGFALTQSLKSDTRTSHIPIILLTAKADLPSKIEGLEKGADAYLPKPCSKSELLIRIKNLLELRQRLQEHYLMLATEDHAKKADVKDDQMEHEFVQLIRSAIEKHLADHQFGVDMLCREVSMSHSQLHRKLTALTGYSANKFIRHIRLNRAKNLLKESGEPISIVAYDTGFKDPDYFGRAFKKKFGQTPTEYKESKGRG